MPISLWLLVLALCVFIAHLLISFNIQFFCKFLSELCYEKLFSSKVYLGLCYEVDNFKIRAVKTGQPV